MKNISYYIFYSLFFVFILLSSNAYAIDVVTAIKSGNEYVDFYEQPKGKVIGNAKSNILLQRVVSQKRKGYVRILGFGRTVWVNESIVQIGDQAATGNINQSTRNTATQGVNWIK